MNKNYIKILFASGLLSLAIAAQSQTINTFAGNGSGGYSGDGVAATATSLSSPSAIGIDATGNVYFADYNNERIRMVNTSGIISTFAGTGVASYGGDGGPATAAQIDRAFGVCVDATTGNVYIADGGNNCVRMVNSSGTISTIAGNTIASFSGDGGPATDAELSFPEFVVTDNIGNLYIADNGNGSIRMVNTSGIISTVVGVGASGFYGDGGAATVAELSSPGGMSIDANGNMYIADEGNNRIRMVNSSGIITTVAGTGAGAYTGDGGPATAADLFTPYDVSADAYGDYYIADLTNSAIRMVDAGGIMHTIAGNNTPGFSGDGGPATAAQVQFPSGVHVDLATGNLYIGDENNDRVRIITSIPAVINNIAATNKITVYPVPNKGNFTVAGLVHGQIIELYNYLGEKISSTIAENPVMSFDITNHANGIYFVRILSKTGSLITSEKIVKAE